jgi:hypothetical protein
MHGDGKSTVPSHGFTKKLFVMVMVTIVGFVKRRTKMDISFSADEAFENESRYTAGNGRG